ncbi:SCO family protein [Paraflavitalea sp. CAU 1676]|uniref:SCO family protein n=1 Tax=Paraflavitalea sp. CAU 1676 TaxID=3032598 RepID=UPI0023D9941D|nr:SCO family protein [Paraflavitalea sp. CAU 1676]MDF2190899.1 SCO family protein [Paraflavitalea sp. CAU 1676]
MSQKAFLGLCIAILLPVISYFVVKTVSRDAIQMPRKYYPEYTIDTVINGKQVSDTVWYQLANDTFTNQLGNRVVMDSLRGRVIIADFFFTRCPSICPYLTRNMKSLQESLKMKDITKRIDTTYVQFLSFSVDPERDSVPVLKQYADRYGVNHDVWSMLTGPKKKIYDYALNEIRLPAQDGGQVDSLFIHTEKFVLIDKQGIIRGYYNGLDSVALAKLAEDLTLLMLEKDKKEPSPVLAELLSLWPIYLVVIAAVAVLMWIVRRPKNKKSS